MYGPCFSSIVGGHPLRSPTRHRLGRPLPYQPADGSQAPPRTAFAFAYELLVLISACGISKPFGLVSHIPGQVTNALLTRSPLEGLRLLVRLACIRHAASVHPEPGSNSPPEFFLILRECLFLVKTLPLQRFSRLPVTLQLLRSPRDRCPPGSRRQKTDALGKVIL